MPLKGRIQLAIVVLPGPVISKSLGFSLCGELLGI